jgi:two-component sensor histidine kinase
MVSSVDMQTYIRELVDFLQGSIDAGMRVRVDCKVEPIELDVVQAIPVGLILNEAITNSIKYAYPGNGGGNIEVSMARKNNNCISIAIGDDGIGLPKDVDLTKTDSLGMSLMNGLARQLDGSIRFRNGKGLKIEIEFPFVSSKGQTELMQ